ncbi:carbohydrate sulfotransferase [Caerostris extrusa]|uniref:Carbohydrate sulfotransferase n=1 Tax=Caerostris extrusa TaxID=172846 RepID=A0AAV4WYZ2_CAEEX|nr:carbohydrate sulfotransferase [Caerostris extrusa]
MDVLCRKCSRHRILLVTSLAGVLLCLALIHSLDRWASRNSIVKLPKQVNDPSFDLRTQDAPIDMERRWEAEYDSRVKRIRDICDKDEIVAMRRIWRIATNRRFGKETYCKTKLCPVIVDEQKVLFFCFIPKVASTSIKKFFLNISDISINDTLKNNDTAFHISANAALRRISQCIIPQRPSTGSTK